VNHKPVVIDGSSQPGYAGKPLVWLDGALAGTVDGLAFDTGSTGSTVRGLSVTGYNTSSGRGIAMYTPAITLVGNYIGLAPDGVTVAGNRVGVETASANNIIGGTSAADMNRAAGNYYAFTLATSAATGNRIIGNTVGIGGDGTTLVSGGTLGVYIWGGAADNYVGGTNAGEGNTIRKATNGVYAMQASPRNRILGNSISGSVNLGIDLNGNGVSANDGVFDATQANNGMDYPVINMAGVDASKNMLAVGGLIGTGTGQAAFAGSRVEFFKSDGDPSGYGEGALYLGFLTADANGKFSGSISVPAGSLTVGDAITATATDGTGNTSEFGPSFSTVSLASLMPKNFNAFESGTAAGSLTGVIQTRVGGQVTSLDVIALDYNGTSLHPSFSGVVSLAWLDARDNSGGLDGGNCRSSWSNVGSAGTLTFTGTARVMATLTPPPASTREMHLRMSYNSPTGTVVTSCSSDAFAVRPASLVITSVSDSDSSSAGTVRSLMTPSTIGGNVHRAGRPFSLRVSAADATGAVMTGYDGSPVVQLASCLVPATCPNLTALSSPTLAATSGLIANDNMTYAEVGTINIALYDTHYADVDASDTALSTRQIWAASVNAGRFVPDHYQVTQAVSGVLGTANAACTAPGAGYTFYGQSFGWSGAPQVTVTALNALGAITTAWTGSLMKLLPTYLTQTMSASGASGATVSQTVGAMTMNDQGNGKVQVSAQGSDKFALSRGTTPLAANSPVFAWNLAIADISEAALVGNGTVSGSGSQSPVGFDQGSVFYTGRLALAPGHGDARTGVRMLAELQRYTPNGWVTMTEDRGCVTVPRAAIAVDTPVGSFATAGVCDAPVQATVTTQGGRAWLSAPGTTGAMPGRLSHHLNLGAVASGQSCQAKGVPQPAQTLNLPYLQGAYGTPSMDQDPSAMLTWGRPNHDIVLQRERF
jgi:hypothetical protein